MQPQTTQLDKQALNLAKAIRKAETGTSTDPYNAKGSSGEYGAYQFMPDTWKQWAGQYLGQSDAEMSVENQNKVAYSRIKELKDQGLNPVEIASLWNSGDKNAYTGVRSDGKTPTKGKIKNSAGVVVDIDVPGYAKKVSNYYNELKGGGQATPIGNTRFQTTVPRENKDILSQINASETDSKEPSRLDTRLNQGSEALGKLSTGVAQGDLSQIASGGLQTAGALAGGVIDATDAALGLIPGYDASMDFLGKKIIAPALEKLGGEDIYNKWQEFATEHPEAAKNIGALGNIASVFPMFKAVRTGMGVTGDVLRAGASKTGFIKSVEDAAKAEIRQSGASAPSKAGKVLSPQNIKGQKVDPVDFIVENDYLPDVVNDANGIPRYQTETALNRLDESLNLDEQDLQSLLEGASRDGLAGYVPISALRSQADDLIKKAFVDRGQVETALKKAGRIFDDYSKYKGDLVPLTELNNMKRGIREAVNFNSPKLGADVRYQLGNLFMENIEEVAEKQGIKEIAELNREMAKKIRAKEALEFLNNRSVQERPGFRTLLGRRSGDVATIGGEAIGQSFGIPGAGAMIGRAVTNRAISGSGKSVVGKLRAKRAKKTPSRLQIGATLGVLQAQHFPEDQSE